MLKITIELSKKNLSDMINTVSEIDEVNSVSVEDALKASDRGEAKWGDFSLEGTKLEVNFKDEFFEDSVKFAVKIYNACSGVVKLLTPLCKDFFEKYFTDKHDMSEDGEILWIPKDLLEKMLEKGQKYAVITPEKVSTFISFDMFKEAMDANKDTKGAKFGKIVGCKLVKYVQ